MKPIAVDHHFAQTDTTAVRCRTNRVLREADPHGQGSVGDCPGMQRSADSDTQSWLQDRVTERRDPHRHSCIGDCPVMQPKALMDITPRPRNERQSMTNHAAPQKRWWFHEASE